MTFKVIMCSIRFTQTNHVLIAQCAHAHSNHVRICALKRVVSVHNSFNFLTTTSGEFWEEYGCCLLGVHWCGAYVGRWEMPAVAAAADVGGGGDVSRRQHKEMKQRTRSIVTPRRHARVRSLFCNMCFEILN